MRLASTCSLPSTLPRQANIAVAPTPTLQRGQNCTGPAAQHCNTQKHRHSRRPARPVGTNWWPLHAPKKPRPCRHVDLQPKAARRKPPPPQTHAACLHGRHSHSPRCHPVPITPPQASPARHSALLPPASTPAAPASAAQAERSDSCRFSCAFSSAIAASFACSSAGAAAGGATLPLPPMPPSHTLSSAAAANSTTSSTA